MENPVISREYVEKNYIHKDVLKIILKDIDMVNNLPVRNTTKKQCYEALQIILYMIYKEYEELAKFHLKKIGIELEETEDENRNTNNVQIEKK